MELWDTNLYVCFQSIEELETELLNGQKLQGPVTASEVNFMLKNKNMENR
jgi:glycerol-3-phosphate dehydrogenase (NAD+)